MLVQDGNKEASEPRLTAGAADRAKLPGIHSNFRHLLCVTATVIYFAPHFLLCKVENCMYFKIRASKVCLYEV